MLFSYAKYAPLHTTEYWFQYHHYNISQAFFFPTRSKVIRKKKRLMFSHVCKDEKNLFNTLYNRVTSQYLFPYSNSNFIIS